MSTPVMPNGSWTGDPPYPPSYLPWLPMMPNWPTMPYHHGCICPVGAEQTCRGACCPRQPAKPLVAT